MEGTDARLKEGQLCQGRTPLDAISRGLGLARHARHTHTGVGDQAIQDAAGTFEYDLEALRHWDFAAVGASRIGQPVRHRVGSRTAVGRRPVTDMFQAAVPSAKLLTIPDADHTLHMTNPELAAATIDEFLRLHPIQRS